MKSSSKAANTLMIVMEYADGGTLDDFLKLQKKALDEKEILVMFSQICLGLHHVHSQNVFIIITAINPLQNRHCIGT